MVPSIVILKIQFNIRQYESWVNHVSWTKRNNMSREEREQRQILNFLPGFSLLLPQILMKFQWKIITSYGIDTQMCAFSNCSNVLVHWFRLHLFASGVRLLFWSWHQNGGEAIIFVCLNIFLATGCSLSNSSRSLTSP